MKFVRIFLSAILFAMCVPGAVLAEDRPARVTIIYDAFGKASSLERGWGYSALIEYGGKRILFDTGGRYKSFSDNVRALHIDLKALDFVVLSHRHGDHTSGMPFVLEQNPGVKIFAPSEQGSFGTPTVNPDTPTGKTILQKVEGIPEDLHYFSGQRPDAYQIDSAWPGAKITLVNKPVEAAPGIFLFKTVSMNKGTLELNELSMAIKTPRGLVVVVGCSHPGIETILAEAAKIDTRIYTVVGGLHLVDKSDQEVTQTVANLKNKWKAERITAGHCTGELAQTQFEQVFKGHHDHPGVGEVIILPM